MTAGVLERAQRPVLAPDDEHSVWPATVFEVVTGLGHMVDHAGDLPHSGPHPLHLERRKLRRVVALGRHQSGRGRWGADRVLVAAANGGLRAGVDEACLHVGSLTRPAY